jgi:hypothetical protein
VPVFTGRSRLRALALVGVAALAAFGLAACSDPPTTEAEGSGERPEECGEPSSLELALGGQEVPFEVSESAARHVDDQTWLVGVGDGSVDLGTADSLGELPEPPATGTRVVIRLHSPDGPLRSGQTLTTADLGVAISVATDGNEMPVTALGAQATVAYVDDTTICGSLSVTDAASIGGSFVASTS